MGSGTLSTVVPLVTSLVTQDCAYPVRFPGAVAEKAKIVWQIIEWFPRVRAGLGRKQLQEPGAKLERARKKAPRSSAQPSALKETVNAIP
jgi:hypothetical protein